MARIVLVVTDQPVFAGTCQTIVAGLGARARVVAPQALAGELHKHDAVVFDAQSAASGDEELLVAVGFARAIEATAAIAAASADPVEIDELAAELCPGLVARCTREIPDVIARVLKRADGRATPRLEYVTLSPRAGELLAILSNGDAQVLTRPCGDDDDGSDVTAIDLAEDASSATLSLESGGSVVLWADVLAAGSPQHSNGVGQANTLDGAKVGSRLRELRKAAGLTQAELARRTGIHRPNIARVEAGRHTPSLDTLARIAAAIGVPATRVLSAE